MSLPSSSKEAKGEFSSRWIRLDEILDDTAPEWAIEAFRRALFAVPLIREMMKLDENSETQIKGLFRRFA
jgi:hypothetical protein